MAYRQGIHIYDQDLIPLKHNILCMIIAVDHMIVMRYGIHQRFQFVPGSLRQMILKEIHPVLDSLLYIRKLSFRHHRSVDKL